MIVFVTELVNSFERLERYVNSIDYDFGVGINEDGTEVNYKNVIDVFQYSGGKLPHYQIDSDNIGLLIAGVKPLIEELQIKESTAPEENQPTKKKPKKIPQSLKECFQSDEDYTKVMGILADKGYIDPENFRWKNKMDKNWKGTICAFLRDFETKGYFKDHIKMNWPIAQAIAKNDFCVKIGGNKTYYSTNLLPAQTAIIPYCNKE